MANGALLGDHLKLGLHFKFGVSLGKQTTNPNSDMIIYSAKSFFAIPPVVTPPMPLFDACYNSLNLQNLARLEGDSSLILPSPSLATRFGES